MVGLQGEKRYLPGVFQGSFVEEQGFVCGLAGWVRFGHAGLVETENAFYRVQLFPNQC